MRNCVRLFKSILLYGGIAFVLWLLVNAKHQAEHPREISQSSPREDDTKSETKSDTNDKYMKAQDPDDKGRNNEGKFKTKTQDKEDTEGKSDRKARQNKDEDLPAVVERIRTKMEDKVNSIVKTKTGDKDDKESVEGEVETKREDEDDEVPVAVGRIRTKAQDKEEPAVGRIKQETHVQAKPESVAEKMPAPKGAGIISDTDSASSLKTNHIEVSHNSTKLLCGRFKSRLGNRLFQYASILGMAFAMNRTPVFLNANAMNGIINMTSDLQNPTEEQKQRCANSTLVVEESCCWFDRKLMRLDPDKDYTVGYFLQSFRYFKEHEGRVRQMMVFVDGVQGRAYAIVKTLRETYKGKRLIGVHIRRGDFLTDVHRNLGYPLTPPEYIHRALAYFTKLFPDSVFVVASDSIDWCKENFPPGYEIHFLGQNSAPVDMAILASLDHMVQSFGTYSWWAAYLNGGITSYMKDFQINGTFIARQFKPGGQDYFYPGWIPL